MVLSAQRWRVYNDESFNWAETNWGLIENNCELFYVFYEKRQTSECFFECVFTFVASFISVINFSIWVILWRSPNVPMPQWVLSARYYFRCCLDKNAGVGKINCPPRKIAELFQRTDSLVSIVLSRSVQPTPWFTFPSTTRSFPHKFHVYITVLIYLTQTYFTR